MNQVRFAAAVLANDDASARQGNIDRFQIAKIRYGEATKPHKPHDTGCNADKSTHTHSTSTHRHPGRDGALGRDALRTDLLDPGFTRRTGREAVVSTEPQGQQYCEGQKAKHPGMAIRPIQSLTAKRPARPCAEADRPRRLRSATRGDSPMGCHCGRFRPGTLATLLNHGVHVARYK